MLRRAALAALAAASLWACSRPIPHDETPPPRGQSYADYLASGQPKPPARPADTNDTNEMVVHVINVGQGNAILLEFPCGAVLVDTGGEKNDQWDGVAHLTAYLDKFFARRTDLDKTFELLLLTHPHLDHTRGVKAILSRYTVHNVVDDGMHNEWIVQDGVKVPDEGGLNQIALEQWARKHADSVGYDAVRVDDIGPRGLTDGVIDPVNGCKRSITDPQIRALWGQEFQDRDTFGDNPNNHSVALRVDFGKSSVFLPGDLEFIGESRLAKKFAARPSIFDVDVYVAGHHGSKNGTSKYLMEEMTPDLAVISAGPYGRTAKWSARRFGHPHRDAINHMTSREYGVKWNRPDPVDVMVGVRGAWKDEIVEKFEKRHISKAVYCTCWDGDVQVHMNANGWIHVEHDGK